MINHVFISSSAVQIYDLSYIHLGAAFSSIMTEENIMTLSPDIFRSNCLNENVVNIECLWWPMHYLAKLK